MDTQTTVRSVAPPAGKARYDFTTLVDRTAQSAEKWQIMRKANPAVAPGIPPFSVADLDLKTAPEIAEGLRDFLRDAVLGYTSPPAAFTRAVIGWMQRRHAWHIEAEWLVQSNGVVPALFTAVRAFTGPGDGVIVQTPCYYPFYRAIESNQRRVIRNPLVLRDGRFEMDFDPLRRLAAEPSTRLLLLCSPHNPTGRVWTRAELRELADIACANDLVVISDEIHFDITLPGHPHTVLTTLGDDITRRTIVCTAPSKSFNLAGMQVSNLVIPDPTLRERFRTEQAKTGFFALTPVGYKACELAYDRAGAWLDGLLSLVGHNRKLLTRFMAEHLPRVTVFDLEGTYLQWMDFRALGKSADELRRLHEQQACVFFDEGVMFGPEGAGFERMNLATPTAALEQALQRLAACHTRH